MLELYIMRHGRTVWNAQGRIQGRSDVELTEEGRELAKLTGQVWEQEGLHFDAIYSSPLKRAYETACLAGSYTGLSIVTDARLREISFGVLEGCSIDCIRSTSKNPGQGTFFDRPDLYKEPEDGESLEEVTARAADFLGMIFEKHTDGERILIVAHGAINKALMRVLKQTELKDFWSGQILKNCAVNIVQTDGQSCVILEEGKIFGC